MKSTPRYQVNIRQFDENCRAVMNPFIARWGQSFSCAYSVKTNRDEKMIQYAYDVLGWRVEVVSEDEYNYVCGLGIDKHRIILNGPYKGDALYDALNNGVIVNLDCIEEVDQVCEYVRSIRENSIAKRIRRSIIGLRVNYDIRTSCEGELAAEDGIGRFGICYENGDFKEALIKLTNAGIDISGLHVHYSTITRSVNVFDILSSRISATIKDNNLNLKYIDLGGGFFGGRYLDGKPTMEEYAQVITANLKNNVDEHNTELILEPGASVIATAIKYLCRVVSVKDICGTRIVTICGTVLHINPFMQKRTPYYSISKRGICEGRAIVNRQVVCGSTCMENDRFFTLYEEEELMIGDEITFNYAGAYTMTLNAEFIIDPPLVEYKMKS